jgi:hypothetical protein
MKIKKIMLAMGSALFLQTPAAQAMSIGEAAFSCVYFVCPAIIARVTGISWVIEMKDRHQASKEILAATDDAAFFKAHVMEAEPSEFSNEDFYGKLRIHVTPEDVLTYKAQIKHTSSDGSYYYQTEEIPLVADQDQPILIDNTKIVGVRINGRPLISNALGKAHTAARRLIIDQVIKVEPAKQTPGYMSDALVLNEVVLSAGQQK